MIDEVWVILTTTPLVTCKWIATTCEDVGMYCFILDEESSCQENERDKVFFKDMAEHKPY